MLMATYVSSHLCTEFNLEEQVISQEFPLAGFEREALSLNQNL